MAATWCVKSEKSDRFAENGDVTLLDTKLGLSILLDGHGAPSTTYALGTKIAEEIQDFIRGASEDRELTWPFPLMDELTTNENLLYVALKLAKERADALSDAVHPHPAWSIAISYAREGRVTIARWGGTKIYQLSPNGSRLLFEGQTLPHYRGTSPLTADSNIPLCALGITSSLDAYLPSAVREWELSQGTLIVLASSSIFDPSGDPILLTSQNAPLDPVPLCEEIFKKYKLYQSDRSLICIKI